MLSVLMANAMFFYSKESKEKKYIKKINFLILVVAAHVHARVRRFQKKGFALMEKPHKR